MYPRKSKKIILLSDGTGNSSISRDKSNVWRLFQSLDLGGDEDDFHQQIAFYDDGVGTSGFRPLTILGGAFGWGLSRNVRDLYTQLCRHYQPGDKIYIFGFSRGAFTARVLAHFIGSCGILNTSREIPLWPHNLDAENPKRRLPLETEQGFKRAISKAYKSYRKSYWQQNTHWIPKIISAITRTIRNKILRSDVLDASEFKKTFCYNLKTEYPDQKDIEFIGVWDTVDAVGLPIDELANALDKYIYPYQFKDQILGDYVEHAAHALAIDDERHTFHPILWDQSSVEDQKRIQQVWFCGMHSNVGGGYPEDDLALIPLNWMMTAAGSESLGLNGLTYNTSRVEDYEKRAQPTGKMYDSRRGAGVFYRYRPRNIYRLCHNENTEKIVDTGSIVMHHSVLERIRDMNAGYAPAGIPRSFLICEEDGSIVEPEPGHRFFERFQGTFQRGNLLSRSEDIVAWGRVAYFSMLAVALALVAFPLYFPGIPGWVIDYNEYGRGADILNGIAGTVSYLEYIIPRFWTDSWQQHIVPFLALVGLFIVFFGWGKRLRQNIQKLAEAGWSEFKGIQVIAPRESWAASVAHFFRTNSGALAGTDFLRQKLVPLAFLAAVIMLGVTAVVRVIDVPMVAQIDPCKQDSAMSSAVFEMIKTPKLVDIDVKSPCIATGISLEKGRYYKVEFVSLNQWMDASVPANNKGFEKPWDSLKLPFPVALPLRRHLSLPWFVLTAQVGLEAGDTFPMNKDTFTFQAQSSGPMYLYVNDAINRFQSKNSNKKWDFFYKNNEGTASMLVTKLK